MEDNPSGHQWQHWVAPHLVSEEEILSVFGFTWFGHSESQFLLLTLAGSFLRLLSH